jgi:hypothetical protein
MKRVLCLLTLGSICGLCAFAQEGPKADLFFGYSFLRYNSAQTIPAFTANGGIGTFAWNFNNHIAMEAELGGYHNGNVNNYQFDTTSFSYLFGPRFSWGRSKRWDPYIHTLFGGQNASTSIAEGSVLVVNPLSTEKLHDGRYQTATNSFAMSIGGGLDIKLSKSFTLRPVQADYYLTRFEVPDVTEPIGTTNARARSQHDFRYAAGIAFNFGAQ